MNHCVKEALESRLLDLCHENGIPEKGWYTASIPENPVQIYDLPGGRFSALTNQDTGTVRVYDRTVSRLHPVAVSL